MTELEQERRLTAVEDRAKSNSRRIEKLEEYTEAINRLATSMEVMAEKHRVADTVEKLDGKVTALEAKPGKRWEGLTEKLLLMLATAAITLLLAQAGIKL